MVRWFCFAAVLLASSVSWGQISMESKYEPHKPIVAKSGITVPDGWELSVRWIIRNWDRRQQPANLIAVGSEAHIWAPPGEHFIEMRARLLKWKNMPNSDGAEELVIVGIQDIDDERTFTVVGSPPPPPDPDDPDKPKPPDEIPDGHYGLIRASYEWALLVPQPHRAVAISQIAINFGIASVATTLPSATLETLKVANLKVLPNPSAARTAWLPFFEKWSQGMDELLATGRLANITSSYQKAFAETQQGLEAAAKESR